MKAQTLFDWLADQDADDQARLCVIVYVDDLEVA